MQILEGIWTALWTPTDRQGNLLKDAIAQQIHFQKSHHVHGLVVGGSTGEFIRLKQACREELLEHVVQCADSLPVIMNISDSIFDHVKSMALHASKCKVAAVMILPPSYFPVSQEDIVAYYIEVAKYTYGLPLILYNFPECVRNALEIDTIKQIANTIPVAGIKHSGKNFLFLRDLAQIGDALGFSVFTGAETRLSEAMRIGAKGSIGALANGVPELVVDTYQKSKKQQENSQTEIKLQTISEKLQSVNFPYNIAALMEARGLNAGVEKIARSSKSHSAHEHLVYDLKQLFAEWHL